MRLTMCLQFVVPWRWWQHLPVQIQKCEPNHTASCPRRLESLTTLLWKTVFLHNLTKLTRASWAASYENGTKLKQAITSLFLKQSRSYCEQIKQICMLGGLRYLLTNISLFVPLLHSGYTQTSYGWWHSGCCSRGNLPKAPVASKV
jgi:hypothetical protein